LEGYTYLAWLGQSDKAQNWTRCQSFDALGRAIATATAIDGVTYTSSVVLDALGRPQRSQDPGGKWLKTEYGARGHALRLCESSASDASTSCAPNAATTYLDTQATDAFGNVVKDTRGGSAAMQTWRSYDTLNECAESVLVRSVARRHVLLFTSPSRGDAFIISGAVASTWRGTTQPIASKSRA
jgi:hypothetical protein